MNKIFENLLNFENIRRINELDKWDGIYNIEIDKDINLLNTNISLSWESIRRHLKDCNKVIVFACTLGIDIEKKIKLYEKVVKIVLLLSYPSVQSLSNLSNFFRFIAGSGAIVNAYIPIIFNLNFIIYIHIYNRDY